MLDGSWSLLLGIWLKWETRFLGLQTCIAVDPSGSMTRESCLSSAALSGTLGDRFFTMGTGGWGTSTRCRHQNRTGWWFGCHFFWHFPINFGNNHHPNWRTHIFQRGGPGPPTRWRRMAPPKNDELDRWTSGHDASRLLLFTILERGFYLFLVSTYHDYVRFGELVLILWPNSDNLEPASMWIFQKKMLEFWLQPLTFAMLSFDLLWTLALVTSETCLKRPSDCPKTLTYHDLWKVRSSPKRNRPTVGVS